MTRADRKAAALLRHVMTPLQRRWWKNYGFCAQRGKNGRVWLICKDLSSHVILLRQNTQTYRGIAPVGDGFSQLPLNDCHLAHLLAARANDRALLRSCISIIHYGDITQKKIDIYHRLSRRWKRRKP